MSVTKPGYVPRPAEGRGGKGAVPHPTGHQRFARHWAAAIADTSYVPLSRRELERYLTVHTHRLADALHADDVDLRAAHDVGVALVENHFTGTQTLGRTIRILGQKLLGILGCANGSCGVWRQVDDRLAAVQGALAAGYAQALRDRTFDEQEGIRRAAGEAKEQAENALRASEARFRAVFEGAAIGIGVLSIDGQILATNQTVLDMMGFSTAELQSTNIRGFVHPDDGPEVWSTFESLVRGERDHFRMEKQYFRADGSVMWTDLVVSLIRDREGKPEFIVGMVGDITEQHELRTRLQHAATHDPLTDLPNRTMLWERLARVIAEATPHTRLGVCYIDLDDFKAVNDALGHHVGDALLKAVAHRFDDVLAEGGHFVARMGGDEFVLLVRDTAGADDVRKVAERVLAAFAEPFRLGEQELLVSASVGMVERAITDSDPNGLIRDADLTLYQAKADGKNRYALYDAELSAAQLARYALSADMPRAVHERQFFLEYQPLVGLDGERVVGVEALVRWHHPSLGLVRPDSFIPLAEETGIIVPLGRWILEDACTRGGQWYRRFGERAPLVSVNLSARQIHTPGLVEEVGDVLRRTGLPSRLLQLEITESAVLSGTDEARHVLERLAALGVRLSLDDFGTGHCNLAYLRDLPVHNLKIAGSFIDGLRAEGAKAETDERIVATMVSLAHTLGLTVTAEGIETRDQADRLSAIDCDLGQGWLFAKSVAPEMIDPMLSV